MAVTSLSRVYTRISRNSRYGTGAGGAEIKASARRWAWPNPTSRWHKAARRPDSFPLIIRLHGPWGQPRCRIRPPARRLIKSASRRADCRFSYRFQSPMPRFYFDVSIGSASSHDEAGYEIDSLHAAEIEARRSAVELTRDRLVRSQSATSEDIRVEVKDEHRQPVLTVTVSIQVDHGPGSSLLAACNDPTMSVDRLRELTGYRRQAQEIRTIVERRSSRSTRPASNCFRQPST